MLYTPSMYQREKKFSSAGMKARLSLAALDHNFSAEREQACTKAGVARYKQEFSKSAGGYIVKPIKVDKDYSFRKELLSGITERCLQGKLNVLIVSHLKYSFRILTAVSTTSYSSI